MALKLFLISFILCYIIDVSGFMDNIKRYISKLITGRKTSDYSLKPLDCSTCMNFWVILIYMLYGTVNVYPFTDMLVISFSVACMFSLMASQVSSLIWLVRETTGKIINKLFGLMEK